MRRWTASLLAAVLVGGSLAVVIALATEAGIGQEVETPARHVGDRALYTVRDGNGTLLGQLRVEQLAPFAARGGDGAWHAVEALRQTFVPDPAVVAGDDPDALAERVVEPWRGAEGTDLGMRLAGGNETYSSWVNRYNDVNVGVDTSGEPPNVFVARQSVIFAGLQAGQGGWCGLRHAAQGVPVQVRPGLTTPAADCASPRLGWLGRADDDGRAAQVFGTDADTVWVVGDSPYPIRIETDRAEGRRVLDLAGFEAGSDAVDLAAVEIPTA
ncbi:MAG: hypothetical protein QOC71_654, partial [Thermoplasmata archaeon]|nr:hypothetical protein [Thermoplasmata archaeon]